MFKLLSLLCVFTAASLVSATYNQTNKDLWTKAVDKTVSDVAQPLLAKLPIQLKDYKKEIFPPKPNGAPPKLLTHYSPRRFDVLLSDVQLLSIGSIKRVGECVTPNKARPVEAECSYKVTEFTVSGKGKNGQVFKEKLTFTLKVATDSWVSGGGFRWTLWSPWAPGSGENKPIYEDTLTLDMKNYLASVDNRPLDLFKEYLVAEFRNKFLNQDVLEPKFNEVLKELKLV